MASQTQEAAGHAAEAANTPGMPQLDFSTFGNQIFWLLVALVAIYYLLDRIALPRIAAVLAERQGTISNDLAVAEQLKQKARDAEAAYDAALAEARVQAGKIVEATKGEIQKEIAEAMAQAEVEISEKTAQSEARISDIKASAIESVKTVASDTAKELVSALGHSTDDAAIDAALANRMKG